MPIMACHVQKSPLTLGLYLAKCTLVTFSGTCDKLKLLPAFTVIKVSFLFHFGPHNARCNHRKISIKILTRAIVMLMFWKPSWKHCFCTNALHVPPRYRYYNNRCWQCFEFNVRDCLLLISLFVESILYINSILWFENHRYFSITDTAFLVFRRKIRNS